ncbi:MAG TPA: hypothetical protein VG866_00390 [Candidatus Paceibacterota bacterium]|nr:hypothetical protein [Candidatus Paceibacterota bacterium]
MSRPSKKKQTNYGEELNTLLDKGRFYLHARRFSQALSVYKKALSIASKEQKHRVLNGMGNIYRSSGTHDLKKLRQSVNLYHKAIKDSSSLYHGLYFSNLSASLAALDKWGEAIETAKKAIELLRRDEKKGIPHGNQIKILELEVGLYREHEKREK